jgi:molybdate transport system substrate-binding protein
MKLFIRIVILISVSNYLMCSCAGPSQGKLTIASSSNLQFVMPLLLAEFETQTHYSCDAVFGSSGKLFAQINAGAPFDVFLSADTLYPTQLKNKGMLSGKIVSFARGSLVLWSMDSIGNSAECFFNSLPDTNYHWAMANPQTAPYGFAAQEYLQHIQRYKAMINSRVLGESVSQVNQFIYTQAVYFGFTSKSSVVTKKRSQYHWIEIPKEQYHEIQQTAIVLKKSKNKEVAHLFIEFLQSSSAIEILNAHGYTTINYTIDPY